MENNHQEAEGGQQNGINKDVLEQTLRVSQKTKNVEVLDFTTRLGCKKGDNYASVITAVDVKARVGGSRDPSSFHFIVKMIPEDPARRKILEDVAMFPKEIKVYHELLPALVDVQKHFGVKDPMLVQAPELYSSIDQQHFLVFQDLSQLGYKMGNKFTGLDYKHCRLAMQEIGKFHALTYALKLRYSTPLLEQYPFLEEVMLADKMEAMFGPFMENSYNMAIKTVEASDVALAERMKSLSGQVYQKMKEIRLDTEDLEVICHGDCWVNNMLFKYEKQGEEEIPVAVKLLDFQIARVCSPTLDLAYFFYTSTPCEVRRDHLKDLLKFYHDTFTSTLHSMGKYFPAFTFQKLQDKFDKDRLIGFIFACMALPLMMARPEESLDMDNLELDMNDTQIVNEFKSRMEENLLKMKDNQHFQDRLRGVAEDMVAVGLL